MPRAFGELAAAGVSGWKAAALRHLELVGVNLSSAKVRRSGEARGRWEITDEREFDRE